MKRRRVRFTATAREQVRLADWWWRENSLRPQIFHDDLGKALDLLSRLPGIGSVYPEGPVSGLRRLYLERLRSHVYYTFDDREVVVRSLWHASRGSGPDFGSP